MKTLVDAQFRGTCYKAANWIYLGETRGRGRMDQHHEAHGRAVKRIYSTCCAATRSGGSHKTPRRVGSRGKKRDG